MDPFKTLLIKIDKKLKLPQPIKSRIILEISADLNDAYQNYMDQGMTESEAIAAAKEKFDIDKHSLHELVQIHQSFYRRWYDQLSSSAQSWWERIILFGLLSFILISGGITIMKSPLFLESSPFVYLILSLATIACGIFVQKIYQIYIKKDHNLITLRKGIPILLFISGLSLIFCIWGYYWKLYTFKEYSHILETKMIYLLHTTDSSFPAVYKQLITWMIESASFVMISMIVSIVISLMWYFIMAKISKIEEAEAATTLRI